MVSLILNFYFDGKNISFAKKIQQRQWNKWIMFLFAVPVLKFFSGAELKRIRIWQRRVPEWIIVQFFYIVQR